MTEQLRCLQYAAKQAVEQRGDRCQLETRIRRSAFGAIRSISMPSRITTARSLRSRRVAYGARRRDRRLARALEWQAIGKPIDALPANQRNVGIVFLFQNYALFPDLPILPLLA